MLAAKNLSEFEYIDNFSYSVSTSCEALPVKHFKYRIVNDSF